MGNVIYTLPQLIKLVIFRWLVDPQLEDLVLAIGSMSYNQVVESIISGGSSDDQMAVSKSILAQQFLEVDIYKICTVKYSISSVVFFRTPLVS